MSEARVTRARRRLRRHNRIHGHVITYQKPDVVRLDSYREIGFREGGYIDIEAKVDFQPSERKRRATGLSEDATTSIDIDRDTFNTFIQSVDQKEDRIWIPDEAERKRDPEHPGTEHEIVSVHPNAGAYARHKVILGTRRAA